MKENENFTVEANVGKGCKLKASVSVKKEQVKKAYKQAVKEVNKEVSLPGFRKGKAPDDAIIKQYSAPIEKEWKEIVVNDAFQATLKLTEIYPYSKNSIEKPKIETCSLEDGAKVSISYECYPVIPDVNFSDIKLPKLAKKEVSEDEINDILKEVRQAQAKWEEIENRGVEEGDWVDISIDKIDEATPRPLVQKRRFEVSPVMVVWLKKMLLGLTKGATVEGKTEEENQEPIPVRVTLHAIQKILLPDVDDELAKKTGAENKDDLIAKIKSNLERDAEVKLKEEKIRALEDILIKKYTFEVPASLLQNEIETRKNERLEELKRENLSQEKLESEQKNIDHWAKEISEQSLRLHFLLVQIGEKGKVQLTREELNEKLNHEILSNPGLHRLVKEDNEKLQTIVRRLTTHFQNEKIREYALEQVEG